MRWTLMIAAGALGASGCSSTSNSSSTNTSATTNLSTSTVTASSTPASTATSGGALTTDTASSAVPATAAASPTVDSVPSGTQWFTFDGANDRRGIVDAGPDPASIAKRWTSPVLDGVVYGQVLVKDQTVFAATEGDSVVALSADDGHVLWTTIVGRPVPKSSLPCGNIDPTGITSTPVIDPTGRVIYVVAFVQPGTHDLLALDTATGTVLWRHPIDPPGLSPLVEQQRSALGFANDRVYVAFGGLYGDCGPYKGAVVSLAADGSGDISSWIVPTEREGGLWAPAGPSIDATGSLVVAAGNAASTDSNNFDYGNAVVRLTPDLKVADYFAPNDWATLSADDADLGSLTPIPIDNNHLFVAGKGGVGYVLASADLGHIGGEVSQMSLCGAAFGGAATNGAIVVVGCSDGPTAATVTPEGVLDALWQSPGSTSGAPLIVGDVVWISSTDGHTRALDINAGTVLADITIAPSLKGFPGTTITPNAVYVTGAGTVTALANP